MTKKTFSSFSALASHEILDHSRKKTLGFGLLLLSLLLLPFENHAHDSLWGASTSLTGLGTTITKRSSFTFYFLVLF